MLAGPNLVQVYEAEFSPITQKMPDESGLFHLDTPLEEPYFPLIAYVDGIPCGIANLKYCGAKSIEMCEFYIVPVFRNAKVETRLAHKIWSEYPGRWTIKQLTGAEPATLFWRSAIGGYNIHSFKEDVIKDKYWGVVTQQMFSVDQQID